MLNRLRVQGFKSLRDVEVYFSPLTILFGPNAAGKSNLLDALHLLSRIARTESLNEAFSPPFRGSPVESLNFPPGGVAALQSQGHAAFTVEIDLSLPDSVVESVSNQIRVMEIGHLPLFEKAMSEHRSLRYRIGVDIATNTGGIRVVDEFLAALTSEGDLAPVEPFIRTVGQQPASDIAEEELGAVHSGAIELRREDVDRWVVAQRGTNRSVLSSPLYPTIYSHLAALKEELSRWAFIYLEPRGRMRGAAPLRETDHIGFAGEDLIPFLNTLKAHRPGDLRSLTNALKMLVPSVTGIELVSNSAGEVELVLIEGATPISAASLSDGTLRVLGLLATALGPNPPTLLGVEEPENGVHPERLRLIAEWLKTRARVGDTQVVATTHSPFLLDLVPRAYLRACSRSGNDSIIRPITSAQVPVSEIEKSLNTETLEMPVSAQVLRGALSV